MRLYHFEGSHKCFMRCAICNIFRCPVIEFVDMENHIITNHPLDCYCCQSWHRIYNKKGDQILPEGKCKELFINHKTYHEHKRFVKQLCDIE